MTPDEKRALGLRLRAERDERGLTQREVAKLIRDALAGPQIPSIDTLIEYVKRWERGRSGIGVRYRRAYARAFGTTEQQLFALTPSGDDVQRREFLSLSAAAAGLAVAPPSLTDQQGRRVGAGLVDKLRRRTARLRRLDEILGGTDTYPVYASELSATRALVERGGYSEATGRGLLGVMAEQAQQAGWAALDSGQMAGANALFRESMTAASEAGEPTLIGNALALMAYHRVSTGRSGTTEADASCRVVDDETPAAVRALLYERAAWAHAVAGSTHTSQVEQALDKAREALAGGADDTPDWARWVDETELQIMTGRCWSQLRRPDRAVPALEWALARYDDAHARDKALYLTWLSEALLDSGEVTESARILIRSIDLGSDVASARPRARVTEVAERLRPHASIPAVAETIERATMTSSV
ncbi:helix-turn-helix domain-containing protein [Spirillospora sp. NBC_01491]|uniref:helix-turn-helix domain-containing protein n=1 Tax=Spirillospora sp. NBC_01491 TaxID=2976007 RepID=UPI002E313374|nr:helix-turn-helix transcriptional regulator [Spirillospora sp. NBC_01491]